MSLITLSIPIFFLLIGLELLITRIQGVQYYRFNDAITNLSCGIGSQITGIFMRFLTIGVYIWIYDHTPLKGWIPGDPKQAGLYLAVMIVLFLGVDFFYYWFHRLAHEISVIWGSHVVHHQSEEYNLTVALRQAWVQGAFSWVFYLPLAALGFDPAMFVTIASIQTLYQFWIHTKVIGRMPRWFEYVFNSPSHHRVHHGVNPKYIDKNHAGTLIIWDRVFGTFQEEEEEVVYGITTQPKSWNPILLNVEYWYDLAREAGKAGSMRDSLRMFYRAPGWKPAEMGGMLAYKEITPATFEKYDAKASAQMTAYIFIQFVLLLAGTSAFLFGIKEIAFPARVAISLLVIFSVLNIGGLFESRRWAIWAEALRATVIAGVLWFFASKYMGNTYAMLAAGVYLLVVLTWLWTHTRKLNLN
ncbi:MAG: sterol desaturase family protein [Bacteroidetes bacterium]|nr:sterol desaturase family protein [Bacteroidota bacterium]